MLDTDPRFRLLQYFDVYGKYHVDDQGHVHVKGNVKLQLPTSELGITFATITGDFEAHNKGLQSLKGLPSHLGGDLLLMDNALVNLRDAPKNVVGKVVVDQRMHPLTSLEGMSSHVGNYANVRWHANLPLLRLLVAPLIYVVVSRYITLEDYQLSVECEKILNDPRWVGKGKQGMLNCALELKRAGFVGNAAW
jgi:hypothetical protein